MPPWLQHLLVLTLVAGCVTVVARQLIGTFRLRRGTKLGSCCAKGCEGQTSSRSPVKPERIVFIPSNTLVRRG